jgi:hypothetical protein
MKDRGMFKKNLFLLCALTSVCAPIVADSFHEEDTVDVTKGKKCCRCCSLTVTNNASIGGNLTVGGSETVGGSVTAARFITPSGGPLLNWAVFSNTSGVLTGEIFTWSTTPATSITAGIRNNGGVITLPIGGTFVVTYTVRITATGPIIPGSGGALVFLEQGSTGSGFNTIDQPTVIVHADLLPAGAEIQSQITGQAIIITTSATNNQIQLLPIFQTEYTIPLTGIPDANANMTIQQLI